MSDTTGTATDAIKESGPAPQGRLKDSCTACAASKVRCGREKPVCSRCERRGDHCEYTPARRVGRTYRNAGKAAAAEHTKASAAASKEQGSLQQSPANGIVNTSDVVQDNMTFSESMTLPDHMPGDWVGLIGSMDTTTSMTPVGMEFENVFESPTSLPVPELTFSPHDTEFWGQFCTVPAPLPAQSQDNSSKSFDSTNSQPTSHSQSSNDCMTVIQGFLTKLFQRPLHTCALASKREDSTATIPTIEMVAKENRAIMEGIEQILNCPCSHDDYFAALISLVVLKVIAWYRAASRVSSSRLSSPVTSYSPRRQSMEQVRFSASSTHDGDYGHEGESRKAAQLVLSELHRARRLLNLLTQRKQASQSPIATNVSPVMDTSDEEASTANGAAAAALVLDHLVSDLAVTLNNVSLETINLLRKV